MLKIEQRLWTKETKWEKPADLHEAGLVFVFAERELLKDDKLVKELRKEYPKASIIGCSTAGEIQDTRVLDNSFTATAVQFEHTQVQTAKIRIKDAKDSFSAGKTLAGSIPHANLKHLIVISVGLNVNGSELVKGLTSALPQGVIVTGGLAGDQARFSETVVCLDQESGNDLIAVAGLYGDKIHTGSASLGGWDAFGPERVVTKSDGNVLFELDGKSALEIYKSYLGDYAKELPGSALLFPLSLRNGDRELGIVRTILSVDEKTQSMTFAGDIPAGSQVRFMKANFDRLVEGAAGAAEKSMDTKKHKPELALLISCVGRKIVLKQRVEEEVEGVRGVYGEGTALTGFYSYGEISPFTPSAKCELHNQTMTITTLWEEEE